MPCWGVISGAVPLRDARSSLYRRHRDCSAHCDAAARCRAARREFWRRRQSDSEIELIGSDCAAAAKLASGDCFAEHSEADAAPSGARRSGVRRVRPRIFVNVVSDSLHVAVVGLLHVYVGSTVPYVCCAAYPPLCFRYLDYSPLLFSLFQRSSRA